MRAGDRWFERHAWIVFALMGVFILVEAPLLILGELRPYDNHVEDASGRPWEAIVAEDPGIARYIELAAVGYGFVQLHLVAFMVVVAATAYRRGERWAWWLFWSLPATALAITATMRVRFGVDLLSFTLPVIGLSLLGLLLPLRRFFPRAGPASPGRGA